MNKMERVVACLQHKEADRVPVYPVLSGVTRKLIGVDYSTWANDARACADALIKAADEFEQDCIVTLIDLSVECEAWGQKLIHPENEAAHPDYSNPLIKGIEEYSKIKKIDWKVGKRMQMHYDVCKILIEEKGSELPIVPFVFGPLGVLSMLRNQQDLYLDIYDEPEIVYEAAKNINETLKEYCADLAKLGAPAIMLDTLFASGSIMSKEMWKEMEGGLVAELSDTIRENNSMVMIHNCGQRIYFDAQIESMKPVAISFLYPPDDCKNFVECKEKYGDKVTLIGAVLPAAASPEIASDEQWEKECKSNIDQMAKGGGFILATGCEYPANAPFDRAKKMVEIAKTYGVYNKNDSIEFSILQPDMIKV